MLFTMSIIVGCYMLVSSFPVSVEIVALYLKLQKLDYCASEIPALPDPLISPNSLVFFPMKIWWLMLSFLLVSCGVSYIVMEM
jgi:hypothetical protein